jgi:hypothetical protein
MSTFAFLKLSALVAVLVLATPAAAQSTDEHHDNQAPQTLPAPALNGMPGLGMPGLGMTGPMGPMSGSGAQSPGMGGMMQMMQLMQSSQMMQMAQMMQMMQMMQAMQGGGVPGAMQGAGMPPGMPGAMGGLGAAGGDVEPLIAGYKSALAITDAQLPQWNAFADSLRAGAKHIQQARSATTPAAPAPAQLEQRAAVLEAEASAMKQSEASAAALYDVLSAPQKRAADRLIADHLARM